MNNHPTPGSLFAMGWSMSLSKDFIRFYKSAKKKNYLLMASILIYFLYHPNRSSPKRSTTAPLAFPNGCASSSILPPSRPRVFGWLLRVVWRLAATQGHDVFFSFHFLSINLTAEATSRLSPARSSPVARPPKHPLYRQSRIYLIVVCFW